MKKRIEPTHFIEVAKVYGTQATMMEQNINWLGLVHEWNRNNPNWKTLLIVKYRKP